MITILFFAQLREQLQCEKLIFSPDSWTTISELREELVRQHPEWLAFLRSDTLLCAVNQSLVKPSHRVNVGDEVAFFPPVTGG